MSGNQPLGCHPLAEHEGLLKWDRRDGFILEGDTGFIVKNGWGEAFQRKPEKS